MGITRIANITHLDHLGVPVVAVFRPNSRSLSVSQGKGVTLEAARASGVLEAIESYHAEHMAAPLLLGSSRELLGTQMVADLSGLPVLSSSNAHEDRRMLWSTGVDLLGGQPTLVPHEAVHLDFRIPLVAGGAFLMSSNGLASGNSHMEAISHGLCELIERDANTLWHYAGGDARPASRLNLESVDDPMCRSLLDRFSAADMTVGIWDTTSDVGVASALCTLVDRDPNARRRLGPISGSGCHPRRAIAVTRALTEAAQGRLTIISGSRDDLSPRRLDDDGAVASSHRMRELLRGGHGGRTFHDMPDAAHDTFDADVRWELASLAAVGIKQVIVVDLTKPEFGIPVIRAIVPHLEGMSELPGFVPGRRARAQLRTRPR
jgi:YcaO-like protein with predicted kinase domain